MLKSGKSVIFGDVPSLLEDLRSSYNSDNDKKNNKVDGRLMKKIVTYNSKKFAKVSENVLKISEIEIATKIFDIIKIYFNV